jgi:hypothetical protein
MQKLGIGCFILSIASDRLIENNLTFYTIFINKAGIATEPKVSNAIITHCKNLIRIRLVGDVRQLRTVLSAHETNKQVVDGQVHSR